MSGGRSTSSPAEALNIAIGAAFELCDGDDALYNTSSVGQPAHDTGAAQGRHVHNTQNG